MRYTVKQIENAYDCKIEKTVDMDGRKFWVAYLPSGIQTGAYTLKELSFNIPCAKCEWIYG